jgi:hypothetical protein
VARKKLINVIENRIDLVVRKELMRLDRRSPEVLQGMQIVQELSFDAQEPAEISRHSRGVKPHSKTNCPPINSRLDISATITEKSGRAHESASQQAHEALGRGVICSTAPPNALLIFYYALYIDVGPTNASCDISVRTSRKLGRESGLPSQHRTMRPHQEASSWSPSTGRPPLIKLICRA